MGLFDIIIGNLPEVKGTKQRIPFKEKLKWTLLILVLFYILGHIPLFGLANNALANFEFLSIILGASFGSIISLGIGPIVTASIVLQLLSGTGIMSLDLSTSEGKKRFQGLQKLLSIFFIIFEAIIYVAMGGLSTGGYYDPVIGGFLVLFAAGALPLAKSQIFTLQALLIIQLILGGLLIMFMDEVVSKWGFGSGLSLFIVAGVAQQIMIRLFNFIPTPGSEIASGAIPAIFQSLSIGDVTTVGLMLAGIISTVVVFALSVYGQAMKVEIPLSFGKVRGYGMRWPLNFFYTSNIPVILVAALLANIQLFARLFENIGYPILGTFAGQNPASGIVLWTSHQNLAAALIQQGSLTLLQIGQAVTYVSLMVIGSMVFSVFWMQTAGMDPKSQAKQILSSGLQMQGFRRDERVLEKILGRYIWPLTIIGGGSVGLLASIADLSGALSSGTGLLLSVMIIYKLYEEIAKQHMMDMHPAMRKFME